MRRFTAASVLLLVLSLWSAPLLSALTTRSPEDNLPACCRKNGKHHCMMMQMMMRNAGSGTALSAPFQPCPLFPRSVALNLPFQHLFAPPVRSAFVAKFLSSPIMAAQTETRFHVSFDRARSKRGPPSLA